LYLDPVDQHAHRTDAAVAASRRRRTRLAIPAAARRSRYRGNLDRRQPNVGAHPGCAGHVRCLQLLLVLRGLFVVDGLAGGVSVAARAPAPQSLAPTTGRTPRNLQRLPEYGQLVLEADGPTPDQALADAQQVLKKSGYRTELRDGSVGAERGYTREIGNILFHFGLLGVLVFMGVGGLFKYEGQKIIVEGDGFTNNLVSYD